MRIGRSLSAVRPGPALPVRVLAGVVALGASLLAFPAAAQTVTNVRAQQLSDGTKRVEVLYDLSGAPTAGVTIAVAFSSDGGTTYALRPAASALSGDVGAAVRDGINRRILWDAKQTLPAGTFGTGFRAQVTAENGSSAPCCVLSCSASTNPTTQQAGSNIQFVASATATSCTSTTTYSWTFGDGSTSALQSPSRAYTSAGTYVWSMTARAGDTTCTSGGTVVIGGGGGGAQEVTVTLPGGVALVMVKIPAGSFDMGAPDTERGYVGEGPVHRVTISKDFYMGKYEVTQGQWKAIMGSNPSYFPSCGDSCPVEQVSWNDIAGSNGFLQELNQHLTSTGQAGAGLFRLPTEAEWEYAARGGTQTPFSFSTPSTWDTQCGSFPEADQHMWWCGNAQSKTHPVGQRAANPRGLYDVHGNVWEWCQDWSGSYSASAVVDPVGPSSGSYRVVRGGAWSLTPLECRSGYRRGIAPDTRNLTVGFRLARSL